MPFDQHQVELWIGVQRADELQLVHQGTPTNYQEADAAAIFAGPEFMIRLDLGADSASDTIWTCDLSHEYVAINANYRT